MRKRRLFISLMVIVGLSSGCNEDIGRLIRDKKAAAPSAGSDAQDLYPKIITTLPGDGLRDQGRNVSIGIVFDRAMDTGTITTNVLTSTCSGTFHISADGFSTCAAMSAQPVAYSSNRIFLISAGSLYNARALYQIRILKAVKSADGYEMTADHISKFRTASSGDGTAPPNLVALFGSSYSHPNEGATGVMVNTAIAVNYIEPLNAATVTTNTAGTVCSGSLQVSSNAFASCVEMQSAPTVARGGLMYIVYPKANLAASTTYTVRLTTAVTDMANNALASNHDVAFTTGTTTQTTQPTLSVSSPGNGTTGVETTTTLRAGPSQEWNPAFLRLNTTNTTCSGDLQISANNFTSCEILEPNYFMDLTYADFKFSTQQPLAFSTTYKVRTLATARDMYGNFFSSSEQTTGFTTMAATGGATVVYATDPVDNSQVSYRHTSFALTFSRPINTGTITVNTVAAACNAGTYTLEVSSDGFSNCIGLASPVTATTGNATVIAHPMGLLSANTWYRVRINAGVLDASGNAVTTFNTPTGARTFP